MESYNQEEKKVARKKLICHSIRELTTKRMENTLVTKSTFSKTLNNFYNLIYGCFEKIGIKVNLSNIIKESYEKWEGLYNSTIQKKEPSQLKVLYLAGPEPTNDLDVFLDCGISPYNIWAVEGDNARFKSAINDLNNNSVNIKVHKGSLKEFFRTIDEIFDIVYFDACTTLISKRNNPLDVLKELFINRRLHGLSALITNFAEPKDNLDDWSKIFACWYAPRYEDAPDIIHESKFPDVDVRCVMLDSFAEDIRSNIEIYYDDFLSRFISTFASEIIPFWKIMSLESISSRYFWKKNELEKLLKNIRNIEINGDIDSIPHYKLAPSGYPLIWWADSILEMLSPEHPLYNFIKSKDEGKSLYDAIYTCTLIKAYEESNSGFKTFIPEVCSEKMNDLLCSFDFFEYKVPLTCDIPMKNLLIEIILGLYAYPYINNANAHLSLKYKAKQTWMYSDVFIFDQCRYLFDFIPSIDLIKNFMEDISNQVIVRCCIDSILRQHYSINPNVFSGGFIEPIGDTRFPFYNYKSRENINTNQY